MKKFLASLFTLSILVVVLFIGIQYYSYVFAKHVFGKIYQIERVTQPAMVLGAGGHMAATAAEAMYSYAVAIRTKDGEIVTASSTDRQWSVARKGVCAEAKFYPYPPWNFEKSGTFFNARLKKLKDCPEGFDFKVPEPVEDTPEPVSEAPQEMVPNSELIGTPEGGLNRDNQPVSSGEDSN